MCFGSAIDTPIALLRPQTRSLICNFYHTKRDNCDLIEFGESYRRKRFAYPTDSWEMLDSVEDSGLITISLVYALWSIPRDSVSILHTHIFRSVSKYSNAEHQALAKEQWVENRLRVLHQLDVFASLRGGLAAALMEQRIEKRHLLTKCDSPNAEIYGTMHADENIVRAAQSRLLIITGRERYGVMQEIKHATHTIRDKMDM